MHSDLQVNALIFRKRQFLVGFFIAICVQTYVLLRPGKTFFGRYPLALPSPFGPHLPLRPYALPLLLLAGTLVLVRAATRLAELLRQPRRTVLTIFVLGVSLHLALICSISNGFKAWQERALTAGQGEFLVSAVTISDLRETLQNYESCGAPMRQARGRGSSFSSTP
jgi:hypothetical protein